MRAHLYETHDIWHVVTGFGTDWKSEIGLQAFYLAQVPGPLPATLLAVACLRIAVYEMTAREDVMREIVRGWTMGKQAKALFGTRWNELWTTPLEDVQRQLGLGRSAEPLSVAA